MESKTTDVASHDQEKSEEQEQLPENQPIVQVRVATAITTATSKVLDAHATYEDVFRLYSPRRRITNTLDKAMILECQRLISSVLDHAHTKYTPYKTLADDAEIIDLICKEECNAVHLNTTNENNPMMPLNTMGSGLYPSLAMVNHSCTPNCELVRHTHENGHRMDLVALHDIPAHTEINFSYMNLNSTNERRKKSLRQNFYFECRCADTESKNCNQTFLDRYQCQFCHQGLLLPTAPKSKERKCDTCGSMQVGLNEPSRPRTSSKKQ